MKKKSKEERKIKQKKERSDLTDININLSLWLFPHFIFKRLPPSGAEFLHLNTPVPVRDVG